MGDKSNSEPSHTPGTRKGEEISRGDGKESGREQKGKSHAGRKAGGRVARDSTGVNPKAVENKTGGPNMPPA